MSGKTECKSAWKGQITFSVQVYMSVLRLILACTPCSALGRDLECRHGDVLWCVHQRDKGQGSSHMNRERIRASLKGDPHLRPVSTRHPEIVEKISAQINWASARVIRQLYLNLALLINRYSHISTWLYKIIRAMTLYRVSVWHLSRGHSMISVLGRLSPTWEWVDVAQRKY